MIEARHCNDWVTFYEGRYRVDIGTANIGGRGTKDQIFLVTVRKGKTLLQYEVHAAKKDYANKEIFHAGLVKDAVSRFKSIKSIKSK